MTTIEEKARRYDEALERAKNTIEVNQAIPDIVECVESLFPELSESEDEKIRKVIIEHFAGSHSSMYPYKGFTKEQIIAWLEKQGEQNVNRETKPRTYGDFIKRLTESEQEYLQGYVNKVIEKTKELQKQGEQKPIKEHNVCDFCEDRYGCINPCPVKLIEQKPTDKIEPKFKIGDWVVDKNGTARQILSYKDGIYKHTDGYSATIFEDEWRMWDIAKDAKDGDVIYSRHNTESFEWIGIFRSLDKENKRVFFYGFWNSIVKSFCVCEDEAYVLYDDFSPATKEQRDTLMKAMIDAGYTFDFEKKELKKIEQKPADIPEDFERLVEHLLSLSDGEGHGSPAKVKEVSSELLRLANQQKNAWNEEDEKMLDDILMCGEHHCYLDAENIDWLKSLKERVQLQNHWKPSDEQMQTLYRYAEQNNYDGAVLTSLYNDIKKLKG